MVGTHTNIIVGLAFASLGFPFFFTGYIFGRGFQTSEESWLAFRNLKIQAIGSWARQVQAGGPTLRDPEI